MKSLRNIFGAVLTETAYAVVLNGFAPEKTQRALAEKGWTVAHDPELVTAAASMPHGGVLPARISDPNGQDIAEPGNEALRQRFLMDLKATLNL